MKQLVVLSGKGGTGKTSVTAAFAHLAFENGQSWKTVLADADVDAANLELVLAPMILESEDFRGGKVARIDNNLCAGCGNCEQVCRFDAIYHHPLPLSLREKGERDEGYWVDPIACDGCAACIYQCPENAIRMQEQIVGKWYLSESRYGPLFHADLKPAQENSGKLVTLVKQRARLLALDEGYDLVLVDGPPGIGCPVISAISGADLALIVAEPTVSGVHDMRRALETTRHFGVRSMVCINKSDVYPAGTAEIEKFCQANGIEFIGQIPFDLTVTEAMVRGETVTAYRPDSHASRALQIIWEKIRVILIEDKDG
jgi:MinD superfamily P-loop ATPase